MYLTIDEVKAFNSEELADKTDEQLRLLIELNSGIVDEYCRTKFRPTTEIFTADVADHIKLPKGPLLQVDSILYHGGPLTADRDFFAYPETGIVELANTDKYSSTKRSLYISYQYGYAEVPAIVKKVILDLMKLDVQSSGYNALESQESWDGEYSYQRNTSKTAEDLRA